MALTATLVAGLVAPSVANAGGIIRDAETEALIREYAGPIFRAAGLGSQNIKIHLVNDKNFTPSSSMATTCSCMPERS
ncbi:hypothetical protein AUC70_10180 [Methyloceanibacter stevinii]|uniref:Uncharacterized protein n=1 Tax=Methyloceanibacter stevinii TaxID=1774970 RepID=A0A1E3VKC7_9HYPH|nr:hypothetical protein AUC70_10180 [Methyloceanibacter stevinii]